MTSPASCTPHSTAATIPCAWLLILALLAISAGSARADSEISDNFDLSLPGRSEGGLLNRLPIANGNATWSAYGNVVLGQGGVLTVRSTGGTRAQVPLRVQSGTVTLFVSLRPGSEKKSKSWIGAGFLNKGSSNLWNDATPSDGGQIWTQIAADGTVTVFEGTRVVNRSIMLGSIAAGMVPVVIQCNLDDGTFAVSINGVEFAKGALSQIPVINWARIEMDNPSPLQTQADDFRILMTR